jgi:hypothetical protein
VTPGQAYQAIVPPGDGVCLLTVVHDQLEQAPRTAERVADTGWMRVVSGLKPSSKQRVPVQRRTPAVVAG